MTQTKQAAAVETPEIAPWRDLISDGRAGYSVLILLGVALHAIQNLVILIIMPTVVGDIGGADYYAWPVMLYTICSIIGGASVAPIWAIMGRRRGYALCGLGFLVGTAVCASATTMPILIAARGLQGLAGGMVVAGGMALVSGFYGPSLRRRMLTANQGIWMVAQLLGPVVGGAFAQFGWWRGSFWTMVPLVVVFIALAWVKLPDEIREEAPKRKVVFPIRRLAILATGIFCIGISGPIGYPAARVILVPAALVLIWLAFRLDRTSENRLYPTGALSILSPVGLALWILFLAGLVQTAMTLFLPLLLQVVHGVPPIFVSIISIIISVGWTLGAFGASGLTGPWERLALGGGPLLMVIGITVMALTAKSPMLLVLAAAALVYGLGIGMHNIHLVARTMANAKPGEENITSSATSSIRALGTAFGAAAAGMLSTVFGLGDATDPEAVGHAVALVFSVNVLPLLAAVVFMFMLLRHGRASAD